MNPPARQILQISLIGLAMVAGGCGLFAKRSQPVAAGGMNFPVRQESWSSNPIAVPAQPPVPVKTGPAPLYYLVETATTIRVVDTDTNAELLGRTPVPARTIVTVDPVRGIVLGGSVMVRGPMQEGHHYAIFLIGESENMAHSGEVHGGRPPLLPPAPPTAGGVP